MPTRFPIFIIDASSYLATMYYHTKRKPSDKNIKNFAVYSFCRMLHKISTKFNVAHIVIVWDGYNEAKPSLGLLAQKKLAMEFLDFIRMEQILEHNIQAYDIIFSMVTSFNYQRHDVVIVTHNKNYFLFVNDATTIFDPFTNIIYDQKDLEQKWKFPLKKFPFFIALAGTSTGHIPGVYGIGNRQAMKYVQQFNDLDDLYKNINQITSVKIKTALLEGKDNAYASLEQATPHRHQNPTTVARTVFHEKNWQLALPFFEKYHYKKLISDIIATPNTKDPLAELITSAQVQAFELIIITTKEQLANLALMIKNIKTLSIKIHGSTFDPMDSMPLSIAIAIEEKSVYFIPLYNESYNNTIAHQDLAAILKNIFLDCNIKKIINKAQYTLVMLSQLGLLTTGPIFDITHAASLIIRNDDDQALKKLHNFYLEYAKNVYQNNITKFQNNDVSITINQDDWHAIADVHQSLVLAKHLENQLKKEELLQYFTTIEMPVSTILADMQVTGIFCNKSILEQLAVKLADDLIKITQEIHAYSPNSININSTQQVRKLLFETLKLPSRKKLRKKTSSTDVTALKELANLHPIPGLILKYRELHKYQRPYVEGLLQCINQKTHKIHPMWQQSLGKTGRISASNPNIQSIPTHDLGYGIYIRSAFYPENNNAFICADYTDIELHIIAHVSQDKMLKAALASTTDIHTKTACKLFTIKENEVTEKQRSIAKKINLSIAYGITAYGLAKDQNIPYHQAAFAMRTFFSNFPGVRAWLQKTIEKTKQSGYITTLFGRKRYLPTIKSKNRVAYDAAVRLALNTKIQGSASEIIKIGMIKLTENLQVAKIDGQILIHIHNQIVISVTKADLEATKKIITQALNSEMVTELNLDLMLLTGQTWQDVTA